MVHEGSRVRLRPGSPFALRHPEMATSIGVVGNVIERAAWTRLGATDIERGHDATMHVRFRELNVVALNVPAGDVEPVDHLDSEEAVPAG